MEYIITGRNQRSDRFMIVPKEEYDKLNGGVFTEDYIMTNIKMGHKFWTHLNGKFIPVRVNGINIQTLKTKDVLDNLNSLPITI